MKLSETKKGNMWVGAALYYYGRSMFYLSLVSFFMTLGTFWHTTFSQTFQMPLWLFIVMLVVLGVSVILIDHFWLTPSLMAYSNKVMQEQNPVLERVIKIEKMLEEQNK